VETCAKGRCYCVKQFFVKSLLKPEVQQTCIFALNSTVDQRFRLKREALEFPRSNSLKILIYSSTVAAVEGVSGAS